VSATMSELQADRLTFHCLKCQQELGDVLGPDLLRIGGREVRVDRKVTLLCPNPKCRYENTWRPEPKCVRPTEKHLDNCDVGDAE
jgi:hypothetical protein